ncbi:MAG: hypothetical protein ACERKN_07135 [Velocimicrobium sp.]
MADLFKKTGSFIPDKLLAGNEFPFLVQGVSLADSQGTVKRGTLIGIVSEKGYLTGSTVSEETVGVSGIMTDDVDTSTLGEDHIATMYITGLFNPDALVLAEGASLDTYKDDMKKLGIFTKAVQTY